MEQNLYYLQTNIICVLVLFIIYLSLRNRSDTLPARRIAFNKLLLITAVICVSDVCSWFATGADTVVTKTLIQVFNIVYDAAITWAGYAWLCYVELRVRPFDEKLNKRRLLNAIPLVIMLVLLCTNPLTNLLFSVNLKDGIFAYQRENGIFIHWIVSWFYLVYATVETLIAIRKSTSKVEKVQYVPMLLFIVPPAVAAVVQMFFYGVTTTQCGMTLAVLIIAVNFMMDEVSKDSLTGLNNRRTLESTAIEQLQWANVKFTVFMCDVDRFKTINDTLGHTAGDLVLKRMAQALKKACSEEDRNLFLCRYGGDEFVIYGTDMEKDEITKLISCIDKNIEEVNADYEGELKFGISVGHATGVCAVYEDVEALISMADGIMYEVKQAKKKGENADNQ